MVWYENNGPLSPEGSIHPDQAQAEEASTDGIQDRFILSVGNKPKEGIDGC